MKVYMKCPYTTAYSRSGNSHISFARFIDWLHYGIGSVLTSVTLELIGVKAEFVRE